MDFRILGPIEVHSEGRPVALGGRRQQALLAYLLLNHKSTVSADSLVDELWHDPPASGVSAVQTQISRLRQALGGRITTSNSGYTIAVETDELDLDRFRSLLAEAGATSEPGERAQLLRRADALWRGTPLDGLDVPFAVTESRALEELRLSALEDRIDSDLESGRRREVISELSALVARQPLRERLRAQLILALYRDGRQAEALEAYREARHTLDAELGLEPSPALRELELAILRHDPALARPGTTADAPGPVVAQVARRGRRRMLTAIAAAAVLAAAGGAAAVSISGQGHAARTLALQTPPRTVTRLQPVARRVTHTRPRRAPARSRTASGTVARSPTTPKAPPPSATHTLAVTTVATGPRPVTPSPVTTVRKQTKSKPKPPPATTVTDSFARVVVNGDVWHQSSEGSGWQLTEQAGHLEFSFGAATAPGPDGGFGERLITNCVFPGDFDAEVDYNLTTWPAASGVEVLLEAQFPTAPARIARLSARSGEAFSASLGGQPTTVEVQENSGSLRLTRRDKVVTVSFRHNGQWQTLSSGTSPETAAIAIGVDAAPGAAFGDQPVVADLDNFRVSGTAARC